MRALLIVVVVLVGAVGCRKRVRVQVERTPEGMACQRDCQFQFNECFRGKRTLMKPCEARENQCLRLCPSASDEPQ